MDQVAARRFTVLLTYCATKRCKIGTLLVHLLRESALNRCTENLFSLQN